MDSFNHMSVGQNQWGPILGQVNSPPILEPIFLGIGILSLGVRGFDPWPFGWLASPKRGSRLGQGSCAEQRKGSKSLGGMLTEGCLFRPGSLTNGTDFIPVFFQEPQLFPSSHSFVSGCLMTLLPEVLVQWDWKIPLSKTEVSLRETDQTN